LYPRRIGSTTGRKEREKKRKSAESAAKARKSVSFGYNIAQRLIDADNEV
jgi:hypothetical protein